jgi:hypothetical protein
MSRKSPVENHGRSYLKPQRAQSPTEDFPVNSVSSMVNTLAGFFATVVVI